jgi:hypothetical protein
MRRKEITVAIMIFCAFFVFGDRVYKADLLLNTSKGIQSWVLAISAVTMVVTFLSAVVSNTRRIQTSLSGGSTGEDRLRWFYSGVTLISSVLTVAVGLTMGIQSGPYQWMYKYVFQNLATAIASFLGLFYIGAAFRAFRARTIEAAILLVCGVTVMLTTNPFGEAIWSGFPVIGNWFLNWVSIGSRRGMGLAASVGIVALSFRVILGYERSVSAGGE